MKRIPYFISLGVILLLSSYPLWMGAKVLSAYLRVGYINAADYPKYIIPYTPIAIALILSAALLPLIVKHGKKFALLIISVLGVGIFLLAETGFERVTVFDKEIVYETREVEPENAPDVFYWQSTICASILPPEPVTEVVEVEKVTMEDLAARYSPAFKIHFYLIAILIVLAVLGVVYGFFKGDKDRRKPLIVQAISVAVFIALCVFACFTAFYRTGALRISPLSAWLMSLFFITFGVTAGTYTGALLFGRRPVISRLSPALIAAATAAAMYAGELILLGGTLYRFGDGVFFGPVGACPLAFVDFLVIALSGAITYVILHLIRPKESKHG